MASRAQPETVEENDAVDRMARELGIELPPVDLPDEEEGTWENLESDDLDNLLGASDEDELDAL